MATTSLPQPEIVQQFFNEEHFAGTVEELITALEPPQKSPLPVATQAEILALLWELDGHLKMLREGIHEGRYIRIYNFARRALSDLFGAVPTTDRGMALARKTLEAMPDSSVRKQAFAFEMKKHREYDRRLGLTK